MLLDVNVMDKLSAWCWTFRWLSRASKKEIGPTPISPLFEPTYISSSLLQRRGSGAARSYEGPNGLPATCMSDEATYLGNYRKESTSYVLYMSWSANDLSRVYKKWLNHSLACIGMRGQSDGFYAVGDMVTSGKRTPQEMGSQRLPLASSEDPTSAHRCDHHLLSNHNY